MDIVKDDPVGLKLFILDACRNNPAANFEGLHQGLADTEAGSGQVLMAYATSAGEVAYDGTGLNSPYSSALANALQRPESGCLRHVSNSSRRCQASHRQCPNTVDHRLDRNTVRVPATGSRSQRRPCRSAHGNV
ncbi:caspase family protein [Rhizobium beringeri]